MTTDDDNDAYNLFRQAIEQRDELAWAAIYARYRSLMVAWARQYGGQRSGLEHSTDIADLALARAWSALTPERFADFPTLARLMGYLRMCVMSTAIDGARMHEHVDRLLPWSSGGLAPAPEQIVLAAQDQRDLWRLVLTQASTAAERVVLLETVLLGLPPRTIQARHLRLFPDVAAVYSTKRNLFSRLQRCPELLQLRQDFVVRPDRAA